MRWSKHLPKAPPSKTITLGIRISTYEFGETQTFRPQHYTVHLTCTLSVVFSIVTVCSLAPLILEHFNCLITLKETPYPLVVTLHLHQLPTPSPTLGNLLAFSIDLPILDICHGALSYVVFCDCLHSLCRMSRFIRVLAYAKYCQIMFHSMESSRFIYSSNISWWTFGLFWSFWRISHATLNIHV